MLRSARAFAPSSSPTLQRTIQQTERKRATIWRKERQIKGDGAIPLPFAGMNQSKLTGARRKSVEADELVEPVVFIRRSAEWFKQPQSKYKIVV